VSVRFPAGWDLACALPLTGEGVVDEATSRRATFAPRGLDEVMDAPCLVGRFRRFDWLVRGVPHGVVLDGLAGVEPPPTLQADLQAIVERAAAVFGGELPYARYLFLCLFAADGHGGLEHADSTTLLMARTALCSEKGYREFLALAAHELFHAWNVKRLRPAEFWRYDYERENYTEFLWLVEGWTAYYDDLLCLRAGLFTRSQYLEAAAKNVNAMLGAPGRLRLSLRESSFDAWIRLYRPDEHTRNSSQNYYTNGAVAAMCLDLFVRRETRGARSLDDVLHGLYASTFRAGRGYTLDDVQRVLREVAGDGAVAWLGSLVDDRLEPPLEGLLAAFAVKVVAKDAARPLLGVQFETGSLLVASVTAGTPADEAGLHPGDEILAVAGLRADSGRWADVWSAVAKVGQPVELLLARRGVIERAVVTPRPSPGTVALEVDPAAPEGARGLLGGWLPEASTSPAAKAP
jgi:predicted metalloprotease with PDZ domain